MKKIIVVIVMALILLGCSKDDIQLVENTKTIPDDYLLDSISEETEGQGKRYLGTGIKIGQIADFSMETSETRLFPLFENDALKALVVYDTSGYRYINDENVLTLVENNLGKEVTYVETDNSIYLVTENLIETIDGEHKAKDWEVNIMKKLQKKKVSINPLGIKRIRLYDSILDGKVVTDPDSGLQYANSRIVVRFKDGDIEYMVKQITDYLEGRLRSVLDGSYVFEIEPASYTVLMNKIDLIREVVEFVDDAFLDQVSYPAYNPGGNDPVTE